LVKKSEIVVARYCDFCTTISDDKEVNPKEKERTRAFYTCTICKRDLCPAHCYFLSLPRPWNDSMRMFLGDFPHAINSDVGDARICVECARQPLDKIGLVVLENLKKEFESQRASRSVI
jgi:hypothetical protein